MSRKNNERQKEKKVEGKAGGGGGERERKRTFKTLEKGQRRKIPVRQERKEESPKTATVALSFQRWCPRMLQLFSVSGVLQGKKTLVDS